MAKKTDPFEIENVVGEWLTWAGGEPRTARDLIDDLRRDELGNLSGLRSAWEKLTKSKPGRALKPSQISYALRTCRNRLTKSGYRFVRDNKKEAGYSWRVEKVPQRALRKSREAMKSKTEQLGLAFQEKLS